MASLWLTTVPDEAREHPLPTLKAIREALRAFDPAAGIEAAEAVLETFHADGFAHLGDGGPTIELREKLLLAGCGTALNLDPEAYARSLQAKSMTAAGASPEEVFRTVAHGEPGPPPQPNGVQPSESAYRTAMVLMVNLEGNPMKASSVAIGLARTTNAVAFYTEVVAAMILTFPWLEEMLKQQKLLT